MRSKRLIQLSLLVFPISGWAGVLFDNLSYPLAVNGPFSSAYAQVNYGTITQRFYQALEHGAAERFFMVYVRSDPVLRLNTNLPHYLSVSLLQAFSTNVLEVLNGPIYTGNGIYLWTGPVTNNAGGIAMTSGTSGFIPRWALCQSPSWNGLTGQQVDWTASYLSGGNYSANPTELCVRVESVVTITPAAIYQVYDCKAGSFTLYGLPTYSYTVQYSEDLSSWWPLTNIVASGGPMLIKDNYFPKTGRFYRALVP